MGYFSWGLNSKRIFKLHKRAIRAITWSKYKSHTEPLFKLVSTLKVKDILKKQNLNFYTAY